MKANRKVLIVTYYWPPSGGAGVQRWLKFSKYLPKFGWKPVVYTPENPYFFLKDKSLLKDVNSEVEVIKRKIWEPYQLAAFLSREKSKKLNTSNLDHKTDKKSLLKQFITYIRANWIIPDPRKYWIGPSVKFLKSLVDKNNINIIVTTGPPHSMHLIGYNLKKLRPGLKWIADFRDPWSKLDFYDSLPITRKTMESHKRLEKLVVDTADVVLATSPSMHQQLEPFDLQKFYCITNGYDPEDFPQITANKKTTNKIKIVHTGLLNSDRNPSNLWEGLKAWINENPEQSEGLSIVCPGNVDMEIENSLSSDPHLGNHFHFPGYIERSDLQLVYHDTDIFLLLVNNTHNSRVNIPGKLFEYIATGKRILAICNEKDDVAKILKNFSNAKVLSYDDSPKKYLDTLTKLTNEKAMESAPSQVKRYSRIQLTKDLASLLNKLETI
ncbi:MAG: glycosyl transferase [Saprospirales bacterium]|nr:MAG: glycosyl transferase [Saprospirales bacterium]